MDDQHLGGSDYMNSEKLPPGCIPVPTSFLLAPRTHLKKSRALVVVEVGHGAQILTQTIKWQMETKERGLACADKALSNRLRSQ